MVQSWEHINCCNSIGCTLFGIPNSPHYRCIEGRYHCPECGYSFPPISSDALSAFSQQNNKYYPGLLSYCPECGQNASLLKHGKTSQGQQRRRCQKCDISFSEYSSPAAEDPKYDSLRLAIREGTFFQKPNPAMKAELAHLSLRAKWEQVKWRPTTLEGEFSSIAFTLGFNGSQNHLYVIATADNRTGRIIAVSTNYAMQKKGISAEWSYHSTSQEKSQTRNIVMRIFDKDRAISRRQALYDLDYGSAKLKCNDPGVIVKPVLAAYRHFALVHALTHLNTLSSHHWLEHECFLYGGCLMANRDEVLKQRCHISFVYERGTCDKTGRFQQQVVKSDILWNDVWRCYSQKEYELALCHLTGSHRQKIYTQATLSPVKQFKLFLFTHPSLLPLTHLSPRNVVYLLEHLTAEYNHGRSF